MIRMQRMRELCRRANAPKRGCNPEAVNDATLKALEYLQSKVATIVDHTIREEASQFQQLCAELCLSSEITDQEEQTKRPFADDDDDNEGKYQATAASAVRRIEDLLNI